MLPRCRELRANRVVPRAIVRPYGTGFFYVALTLIRTFWWHDLADGTTWYGDTP